MAVSSDTAVLRVAVTTALGAQPLENALVMVSTVPDEDGSRQLLYSVRTDSGGMTPPMTLSAPPRENSLSPDGGVPYALYTVEAALDGYVPLTALHIALFSGVPALLPVALTPLPEYESTAPAELTSDGQTQVLSSERE